MRRRSAQSGFALLLVLVLVLLAAISLAGMARRSMVEALEARTAVEDLQRRWAVTSCREALLPRAGMLLEEAERGKGAGGEPSERYLNPPMVERRITCRLAGLDYELIVADEQAKLNVNRLVEEMSRGEARSEVARLIADAGGGFVGRSGVRIRTLALGESLSRQTGNLSKLAGYGQVFGAVSPQRLVGEGRWTGLAHAVTCWGDGKVNLRRAPDAVVERACEHRIGREAVALLLEARHGDPYRTIAEILGDLDELDRGEKQLVRECVTDASACHGLWVIAHGRQRSWYTLVVGEGGVERMTEESQRDGLLDIRRRHAFEW